MWPGWLDGTPTARTRLGGIDAPSVASVDGRGMVSLDGWSLDWWVGADDRWHLPTREVAVRQRLVDDMPVVETAMRIPGGDAVHRVYGARSGEADVLVVEIDNQSPAPFALALAIRPLDASGRTRVRRISLDGTTVVVDGRASLLAPRPPSRMASSTGRQGDVVDVVLGGGASEHLGELTCADGMATAAFVWPVPHRTSLRVVVPLGSSATLHTLPSAEQVTRGWRMHGGGGLRLVVPDARVQAAYDAARRQLLLGAGAPADRARALAMVGDAAGAAAILRSISADGAGAPFLLAAATHWRLHRDAELASELAPVVAHVADLVQRGVADRSALVAAAVLLGAAGEDQAAELATRAAAAIEMARADEATVGELEALLDTASPTWTWPTEPTPRLVSLIRDLLVAEGPDGSIELGRGVRDPWFGQGVEVHDAPTNAGLLSFALRWHGDRPALLWDLAVREDSPPVRLTIPSLDPTWSSSEARGDALLGQVLPATPVGLPIGRRATS